MLYNNVYGLYITHCVYNIIISTFIFIASLSKSSLWRKIKHKYNSVSKERSSKLEKLADKFHTCTHLNTHV